MRRFLKLFLLLFVMSSCNPQENEPATVEIPDYAKGADIGWITELESKGCKFYDNSGKERECTALMQSIGCNSVRYRVWVNPENGWNSKEDVLAKALRAKKLGMNIMIDFHYGDSWCDPTKQPAPAAWVGHNADQLALDVAGHTIDVLRCLKENGVDVNWIQIGNEVTYGMLWETCRVSGSDAANFLKVYNAGVAAARTIYPEAVIILHIDNGWKDETVNWFFDLVGNEASFDMMGFSLYPSYWDNGLNGYPDWRTLTERFVKNLPAFYGRFSKPIMLCEFGMPASQPEKAKAALQYLIDNTADLEFFKGIFLWEPEAEHVNTGYDYGAFQYGRPTIALEPFQQQIR